MNILALLSVIGVSILVVSIMVFAQKEETIYVFPTAMSSEGWNEGGRAVSQDLSALAALPDFHPENSAYIAFRNNEQRLIDVSSPPQELPHEEIIEVPLNTQTNEEQPTPNISEQISSESVNQEEMPLAEPPIRNIDPEPPAIPSQIPSEEVPQQQGFLWQTIWRSAMAPFSVGGLLASTTGDATRDTFLMLESTTSLVSESLVRSQDKEGENTEAATCLVLQIPCHILELSGFGVSGLITERPIVSTKLFLSLASSGGKDISANDRIIVRLYHEGEWQLLDSIDLGAEISNERRNGYLTLDVPALTRWSDLVGAKVAIEYVRESSADVEVFLDSAWLTVSYAYDITSVENDEQSNVTMELAGADVAARMQRRNTLEEKSGDVVQFVHEGERQSTSLTLKSDKETYSVLGKMTQYVMVANDGDSPQEIHLQYHLSGGAEVVSMERFAYGIPYRSSVVTYDTAGYFCESGWVFASSTDGLYRCDNDASTRRCDALNGDGTNCLVDDNRVGLEGEVKYRDGWSVLEHLPGSYRDDDGLIARAIQSIFSADASEAIPQEQFKTTHVRDSITLEPGQAVYVKTTLRVPPNTKGNVFFEAQGDDGGYALLRTQWNGSWNHRIPVSFYSRSQTDRGTTVVPIDLAGAPDSFWEKTATSGDDVRFVHRASNSELAMELLSWDKEKRHGLAWVRVPTTAVDATTTIDLYYDNPAAISAPKDDEVFRSEDLSPRFLVLGAESQKDMVVSVIALANSVEVQVGENNPQTLHEGEHLLVPSVQSGEIIRANGPVSASIESVGDGGTIVPFAFSSERFLLPAQQEGSEISLSSPTEETTVRVTDVDVFDLAPSYTVRTPAPTERTLEYVADDPFLLSYTTKEGLRSPLSPASSGDTYSIEHGRLSVGAGETGTGFAVRCERGAGKRVDGRLTGHSWSERLCVEGDIETTEAIRLHTISAPVGITQDGDTHGGPIVPLPETEFDHRYRLSDDATAIVMLCRPEDGAVVIELADSRGAMFATTTCVGIGERPGKAVFRSEGQAFLRGSIVRSLDRNKPFAAFIEARGVSIVRSEPRILNLWGSLQSRGVTGKLGKEVFGEEQFVVPDEHRNIDAYEDGTPKEHVNDLLDGKREFSSHDKPEFRLRYKPRSLSLVQATRDVIGLRQFSVSRVALVHQSLGIVDAPLTVEYGKENDWSVVVREVGPEFRPGKYTLHAEIQEGGETYTDEFDFYWGLLAINYQKSVFTPNETVRIQIAALTENGHTICDADLRLWVTDPAGQESQLPVTPSGKCSGNNVVDVPDYEATYTTNATGTYAVRLVRLDENENLASQLNDSITVVGEVPYVIEREGPTRIYPIAQYDMKIRIRALRNFSGNIIERMPNDYVVIDRGNANLELSGAYLTATWGATMKAGDVVEYRYRFDAPNISPYLYLHGPLEMRGDDEAMNFVEARAWQVASDAAGRMLIFWSNQNYIPSGWTCVSCLTGDTFHQRFVMGSSTYAVTGGTATHTPTAAATVYTTGATGVGPVTTNNTLNAPLSHSHTMTPGISGVSNRPAYRELRLLRADSAGDPTSLPAGAILPFDIASSSLPANWYRYDVMDGSYPFAASTTNVTGGANTHAHTATGTTSAPPESGLRQQGGNPNGAALQTHTHTLTSTSTNVVNHEPPYVEVVFARLSATSAPANYVIGMWNDTPPEQWTTLSGSGGAFEERFLKASTTYGGSGGSLTHQHADIVGATTSVPIGLGGYNTSASNGQAPASHTHSVDVTGFSADSHVPPYATVIYAKRLVDVSVYTQENFRYFANTNGLTPTDPWPSGGADLDELDPIADPTIAVRPGNVLRIRLSLLVGNSTSTVSRDAFKLQYTASANCVSALNWTDVSAIGSPAALWRGYNNSSPANNTALPSVLLSTAQRAESYVEENNSTGTPTQIGIGEKGEWDWVVQHNLAAAGTNYCFRMVRSDGTPLDSYAVYPEVLTNASPEAATLSSPFDNEKIGTTTPAFRFVSSDPETDDLDYQIQISTTTAFVTTILDRDSGANPELFDNVPNPTNKAPFNSGDTIQTRVSSSLTNGTTYWWRVRAKDPNGSNTYGSWSASRSFTVDTAVVNSTWFQTTSEQFQTGTFVGTNSSTSDSIMLNTGSTTGVAYSPAIDFSVATVGTVWNKLRWNDVESGGVIGYQLEYLSSTSTWALIPDSALPGNSSSFGTSPVDLLTIDPGVYDIIRIRATLTNVLATPKMNDWTVEWGFNVNTPTLVAPFDNAIVASTSPNLDFVATDPNNDSIVYQVSWSTSPLFTSSTTKSSDLDNGFRNINYATDTSPFNSGERIRYVFQPADALTASSTYFWRVRGRDPLGDNTWSFWSSPKSFTVGLSHRVSAWYQTVDGQFDTDSLTSLETYGANRLRVATQTSEVLIGYGEGTVQTPRYRFWDGSSWGGESNALPVGSQINWVVTKASPITGEYIMGTLGSDNDVNYQVYKDGSWGNQMELTTGLSNNTARGFDVAYETLSGRALAVSCDGDADPTYRIWDGSSWGATGTIDITSTKNCEWIRLASNPISNEILMVERNTGDRYEAQVWNATSSTWGNKLVVGGSMTEFANEGMAVEYERSGYQGIVAVSNGNSANFVWSYWNGGSWAATTTFALQDDFEWGNIRRSPASDLLSLCYIDEDTDVGVVRWNGSAWQTASERTITAVSKAGLGMDCAYETTTGRSDYIMSMFGDVSTLTTRYSFWNGSVWSGAASVSTLVQGYLSELARALDGTIVGVIYDNTNTDIVSSSWNGTTWSAAQTLETTPSDSVAPFRSVFMMAPKNAAARATIVGSTVDFDDGNSPAWKRVLWTDSETGGSSLTYQVEYLTGGGSWGLIPDSAIPGNSSGTTTPPINISSLDSSLYNQIRLRGSAVCNLGVCPYLDDWTIEWAEGINLTGVAKREDLSTNVTSGTVAVAVNGVLQSGKTGTIGANGQWQIDNVTVFPGNILTLWVDGAGDANEAVAVVRYPSSGDLGGISLNERWVTIGSASTTGQTVTLANMSQFDNSVSADEDIFYDVDAGGDLQTCATGACSNAGLYIIAGNTFRPNNTTARTLNTYNLRIAGGVTADANTIKVGGDFRNLGGYTANTSTLVFNSTSTARTIDQSGAATSTLFSVTFGETGSTGSWDLLTSMIATGTVNLSFGTLRPGNSALTLEGNFTIGASGTFSKGNATTTFSGSVARTLTDNTASKQDLGRVLIDGTSKTLTLATDIRVSDLMIGADDTLDAGSTWNINVMNDWRNSGTFTARSGTVTFLATTTGKTINSGASNFYNLTFNGGGGAWTFLQNNATTTNHFTISTGTPTLPNGTLAVGANFDNSGGSFSPGSGIVRMTSTAGGRTVRANGVAFNQLQFAGSGGSWSFLDTNATTSDRFSVVAGTVTLPPGTLAVGTDFVNTATFSANSGTVRMYAASGSRTLTSGGSPFANLQVAGAGVFTFSDTNATATADVTISAGTLVFPGANFGIGGSFVNSSVFTAGTSLTLFSAASGARTINPGNSSFYAVNLSGAGNFTVTGNATATNNLTLTNVGTFTLNSGLTLAVAGAFFNQVANASTTWTGTTLFLNSGTNYSINTKTAGGDSYGTLKIGAGTQIRTWNSSASTYTMDANGSLYSQDHAAVDGDLYIFGNYSRTSGSDYWNYATDFDGAALGGSSRQANVRFAPSATATYSGATLQILGAATASTSIDRQSTGNYALTLNTSTINAQYYQFRNVGQYGLQLLASTVVTSLRDGDYELNINGGTMMTVASSTIDANPALQIFSVRFATSTGIASGFNVAESGVPTSFWRFKQHSGNYAGENFDNDPGGNPGYIRWDDSNFVIAISGTIYSDAGVTPMGSPTCDNVTNVVRVKVDGRGSFTAPCNSADGTYSVSGVTFSGDTVMTVYLDTNGGDRAALVTRSAVADLTGINLYRDRVIVRHEDTSPMSIANMNVFDNADDGDISFTAATSAPNTLIVKPDTEFWIWNAKTFVPGGNITLQSGGSGNAWDGKFHIDNNATFTAQGTETHSIGGGWQADAGSTFTAANSTFIFTATTTGKIISSVPVPTFFALAFDGVGGGWSISQDTQVNGTIAMNAGTLSGSANVTVNGTSVTGAGAVAMTGGTFQLAAGGVFGGPTDWSFSNLTFAGAGATTTKTGSSTITVSRIFSIFGSHHLLAGTSTQWILSGSSSPFALSGTWDPQLSSMRYTSGSSTNITGTTYWKLWLAPTGSGSPTYSMSAGTFSIGSSFTVGDGSNAVSVNANTSDPVITAEHDVTIRPNATLIASDSGAFNILRDWNNEGVFTSSTGTVTFAATTTNRTITPGDSTFGNVVFDSASGGWTIAGSATTTASFTLNQAQSFTQASGTVLEVRGTFTNNVGGVATVWTGSTLYLNSGTNYSMNTKSTGGDVYDSLWIGANTGVRAWNSSATTYNVNASGSLYSQDHAAVDGHLYVWGAYTQTSGNGYWSYATDFDGVATTPRQVNVRFAPGSSATFSGGSIEIVGTSSATTTIDRQSTGNYGLTISGGSTTIQFMSLRNADANGLRFSGTPVVNVMNDNDFELGVTGGTIITAAGGTIDANPLKTFFRNRFATSSAGTTGANVTATGVSASAWRFNLHYGAFSGEAFDSDPGGDPGYVIWDDSAANITISGNVYSDEGVTPIGGPTCDGVTQNVRLRVQGVGAYTSACNAGTGAFSISNVIFNPGDTLTLYLDTAGGARAANVSIDPSTNISNMHLYQNRVIVRHEDTNPITIAKMDAYDQGNDSDIPFTVTLGSPDTLTLRSGTGLIIWNAKTFDPQGNITLHANASGAGWDGTIHLAAGAILTGSSRTHTIGGQFLADSGAILNVGSTTMVFNATTTGRQIAASSSLTFGSLRFSGIGGSWDTSGVGTSTGDMTIVSGAVTLPPALISVGGSFDNQGGSFTASGNTLRLFATSSGNVLGLSGSSLGDVEFRGTGGTWRMTDLNATTTGSFTITAGTVNLPSGTLAVGGDYVNQGGVFAPGSGTVRMTSPSGSRSLRLNGSSLGNLQFAGSSTFAFLENTATTTGDFFIVSGTTSFPYANLNVGGSFDSSGAFLAGTSTLTLTATGSAKTVNPRSSIFNNVIVSASSGGGIVLIGNATTTGNFTITTAPFFTVTTGLTLAVGGQFTNSVGGSITTWTGSTLSLFGSQNYSINTKTSGGDGYDYLRISSSTQIRSWNSSSTAVYADDASSWYSQDHGATDGSLNVYGNYSRTTGADYWSYATDFDGTTLSGASRRLVNVRFASSATTTYADNSRLEVIGDPTASTTIDRISSGTYAVNIDSSTLLASYHQWRNMGRAGLDLSGTTTLSSFQHGDFELAVSGGTMVRISSSTINQNASQFYSNIRFATSTGITGGANVSRVGTTSSAITFQNEYGNFAGEAYDEDGGSDACGSIRWTDSSCLFSDQSGYRWRYDDGGEGVPAANWYDQSWTYRQRVRVVNTSTSTLSDQTLKLNVPYDANMQSNFADVRFTDSSGTTSIAFWIQDVVTSASSTIWVRVPSLPASSFTDIYMYFGNGSAANTGSSGTSTFAFFDNFEDGDIAEYSGDTSLFAASTGFNYERSYGLAASPGNTSAQATDGIFQTGVSVGRGTTFRYFQYVDASKSDEPCALFAVQSPGTANQNYATCLTPFGSDKITIAKNAVYNGRSAGATELATSSVSFATGWYEAEVSWLSSGRIDLTVYDATGAFFASTTAVDTTYTSGGIGFTFWGQNGGWDVYTARNYYSSKPTATFGVRQTNSGATWKAVENTALGSQLPNQNIRLRMTIKNSGTSLTDQNFRLQVASKSGSPNCESVAGANYSDVPTTSGGCGSAVACMTSSSQFTDRASSTQLLSVPSGFSFAQGQIMEDPSNQSGNVNVANGEVTEVEYNFQMTAFATQPAYCFRTTRAGTALDNYSRVAELGLLFPPTISNWSYNSGSNIALTEGTTTRIYATGTVSDLNGYADIIAATSTFFRSGAGSGRFCSADQNNCYQLATTSCALTDCSGNSCTLSCSAFMQYFADPTDVGSSYASEIWDAFVDVWDTTYSHTVASATQEVFTLRALDVGNTIAYGNVSVGGDTGSTNPSTAVSNTGNAILNLLLSGTDMTNGPSTIAADRQRFATSSFTYSACTICTALATTSQSYNINVAKPTSTVPVFRDIFWGLSVPLGTAASTHNGTNDFIAN